MSLLGEALNINLEVETVEQSVGVFRADIIARVVDEYEPDHRVIIENQFGRTDHGHLGQLLTYLAGIEGAKTVVWIAEKIQQDHRAAIEWLNANTTEAFSFFVIEIELWRIDNSPPAPRFNVIASPNEWTRATRSATRNVVARHSQKLGAFASRIGHLSRNFSVRGIQTLPFGQPAYQCCIGFQSIRQTSK